jgi:hypothetical protein
MRHRGAMRRSAAGSAPARTVVWLAVLLAAVPVIAADIRPHMVPEPAAAEFHFVVLGDSQFHDPALFNRLVDDIRHLNPAFVVQVGDMIEGYTDPTAVEVEWQRFRRQIAPLGDIPFMPVPGNHDLYNAERMADEALEAIYRRQWGATWYHFDYRNTRLVVLNSDAPGAERRIGPAQWRWLEQTLADSPASHVIVFLHRPPASLENADALHALFRKHPVRFVFYGHHHHYHFEERDGIRYVMTNAAATGALPIPDVGGFHHLLLVSVRDDDIRYAAIGADSIRAPDSVVPADNYDLFDLYRNLVPRSIPLEPAGEHRWKATLPFANPTDRSLTLYIQCGSGDRRWQFAPAAIPPQPLAPQRRAQIELTAYIEPARVPESQPVCTVEMPYQTARGTWIPYRVEVELEGGPSRG